MLQLKAHRILTVRALPIAISGVGTGNGNGNVVALFGARRELGAAENALWTSEHRMREILETAPLAFIAADAEGLILDWNTEAELIFGWQRADALGRNLAQTILPPAVRQAYERELSDLLAMDGWNPCSRGIELSATAKDGRELPLDITISRVYAGDSHLFRIYARDITDRVQADADRRYAEERLAYQVLHDPLTNLPNRSLLLDRISHALALATRAGCIAAVLYADIDEFKVINDSFGHPVGDELLVKVARRLQDALRESDTVAQPDHNTLARTGGDEFVALCESLGGEEDAIHIADRMIAAFEQPFEVGGERLFATVSIGISVSEPNATPASLIRDADTAMHRAKERGRARYELFDAELRARVLDRVRKENDLRDAIERGQLHLHYQPIVSAVDGGVVAAEALLRWEHPQHGLIPPLEFIPLAERSGLIIPVGRWILERALTQLAEWHERFGASSPLHISVNVSARQITDDDLPNLVAQLLERHALRPSQLILEVTESLLLSDTDASAATLRELHELGVQLALDDFGTGYSSLAYLRGLPFQALKLDRSFISGLVLTATDAQIAAAVIELARALAMTVVAEGVESVEQLECLRRLGCHLAQGYYFAKPMPSDEFTLLLERCSSCPGGLRAEPEAH